MLMASYHTCSVPPHDSTAPTKGLNTVYFKSSTPMGAQMDASIFATYPVWALGVKMTNALVDN